MFVGYISTFPLLCIIVWFLCLRLQQSSIERALDLTDSFTWDDLPTRDTVTGHLTAAGWIPLTMNYGVRVCVAALCIHIVQSTIRMVKNHETMYVVWYPFDWSVSPIYELVFISQVTNFKAQFSNISPYIIVNLTLCVNYIFLSIFFLCSLLSKDALRIQSVKSVS